LIKPVIAIEVSKSRCKRVN